MIRTELDKSKCQSICWKEVGKILKIPVVLQQICVNLLVIIAFIVRTDFEHMEDQDSLNT